MVDSTEFSASLLASKLEHTLLRPQATRDQIIVLCGEAVEHGFAAVCVTPNMVEIATNELRGTRIPVVTVANFPLGASTWAGVEREIETALSDGASHIDLVIPLALLLSDNSEVLLPQLLRVRKLVGPNIILKCIVELNLLPEPICPTAVSLIRSADADYFKTGTGFFGRVSVEMVKKLKEIDSLLPIKAAGGIANREQAFGLLTAGANLLGSSQSVAIVTKD